MAVTGEIQIGRVSRFLSKWLGTKGTSPRTTISGEIMPVIPLWSGVENRFLDSWNRYGVNKFIAAGGAGNFSVFRMRNPVGSTVMAVIEKIIIVGSAADQPNVSFFSNPATNVDLVGGTIAAVPIDARQALKGQTGSTVIASFKNSTAATGGGFVILQTGVVANQGVDLIITDNQELPLAPSSGIDIFNNSANLGLEVSLLWRERALEDSEQS
jgi:hypothetical protein